MWRTVNWRIYSLEIPGLNQEFITHLICIIFTARRHASAVCDVVLCLSVRPSVRLSVCPSQAGPVSKRLNSGSRKQRHTIAQRFFRWQRFRRNSNGVTPYGAPNRSGVGSNWRFSTNISLYLRNGARQGHSYYRTALFSVTLSDP